MKKLTNEEKKELIKIVNNNYGKAYNKISEKEIKIGDEIGCCTIKTEEDMFNKNFKSN